MITGEKAYQGLVDALFGIRAALRRPDVLGASDQIEVRLPFEAGKRLEIMLALLPVPPDHIALRHQTVDANGEDRRIVEIAGFKLSWPVRRVAVLGGGSVPESWPVAVSPTQEPRQYPAGTVLVGDIDLPRGEHG